MPRFHTDPPNERLAHPTEFALADILHLRRVAAKVPSCRGERCLEVV